MPETLRGKSLRAVGLSTDEYSRKTNGVKEFLHEGARLLLEFVQME